MNEQDNETSKVTEEEMLKFIDSELNEIQVDGLQDRLKELDKDYYDGYEEHHDKDRLRNKIKYDLWDAMFGYDYRQKIKDDPNYIQNNRVLSAILKKIDRMKHKYSSAIKEGSREVLIHTSPAHYFSSKPWNKMSKEEQNSFIDTQFKRNKNYNILMDKELEEIKDMKDYFRNHISMEIMDNFVGKEVIIKEENKINNELNDSYLEGLLPKHYYKIFQDTMNKLKDKVNMSVENRELNLSNKIAWWHNFLEWLTSLLDPFYKPVYIHSNNTLKLDKTKDLNIIPVHTPNHVSAIIVDNVNKKILFFEPNANPCLELERLHGINTKDELLQTCFSSKDVEYFKQNGYETINTIDDGATINKCFDKKINQETIMLEGKCAIATIKYIDTFVKKFMGRKESHYQIDDYQWFLTDILNNHQLSTYRMNYSQMHKMKNMIKEKYKPLFDKYEEYKKEVNKINDENTKTISHRIPENNLKTSIIQKDNISK